MHSGSQKTEHLDNLPRQQHMHNPKEKVYSTCCCFALVVAFQVLQHVLCYVCPDGFYSDKTVLGGENQPTCNSQF